MSIGRRIGKLENEIPSPPAESSYDREAKREEIRDTARRANERLMREDMPPIFEITAGGDVLALRDGKPIEGFHATLAEEWYWDYVEMGNPGGLVHDEETEGFYMPPGRDAGELAFSRTRCYLPRFFWAMGDERAYPWGLNAPERVEVGP